MGDLADQQAGLVAALVAGGPTPDGVPADRLDAAREALLRKRSSEVAAAWPRLAAALGEQWGPRFTAWAGGRPPLGADADGRAFAATLDPRGLSESAVREYLRAVTGGVRRGLRGRLRAVRVGRRCYLGWAGRAWRVIG